MNNKQKTYLRSLANKLKAIYHVGKEGISLNLLEGIDNYLKAHELIKINLLRSCALSANEVAIEISASTNSEIIQIIGKTIVLYRKSKKEIIPLP